MSRLYLRGKSVWIAYSDRFRQPRFAPTGFKLESVRKYNGKTIWPRYVREWKKHFDIQVTLGRWNMLPKDLQGKSGLRLSSLLRLYLDSDGSTRSDATKEICENAFKKLRAFYQRDQYVARISEDDMILWRDEMLKSGNAPATVSRAMRAAASVLSWAVRRKLLGESPLSRDNILQAKPKPVTVLKSEEIRRILELSNDRLRPQLEFLLLTGFRASECCNLTWKDIDFDRGVIRIWSSKMSRWEYFPMDERLTDLLRSLPGEEGGPVFHYRTRGSISRAFRYIARKKLNLSEDITLHTLRANFISALVTSGLSESEVTFLARHHSLATTHKYYTAFSQDDLRKALKRSRG